MTTEQIVGLALALLVMGVGLAGSILPLLPGSPLILAAAIGHRLYFGDSSVGWVAMVLLVVLALASVAMDYVAGMLGAKKLGASWRGAVGAGVGSLVGIFFGLPGILLGPLVGAVAFEMAGTRDVTAGSRAGLGAVIGLAIGALGKVACGLAMIGLFAANVIWRSV